MNLVRVVEDPEIYLLRVPFPHKPHKKTNIYIAVKGGECLLIDVGCGGDAPFAFLEAALESLGFANAPLNVFLTNLHPDHAGLLPYLAQAHRASVIMGEESYRSLLLARKAGCFEGKGWEYLRQNGLPPSDIAAIKETDLAPTVLFDTASVQAIADRDMLHSLTSRSFWSKTSKSSAIATSIPRKSRPGTRTAAFPTSWQWLISRPALA